ncbi:hypothetical protein HN747_01230 [archaeon]|jgi:hypothetical protein|nr:hypothetical protein [archaeon]
MKRGVLISTLGLMLLTNGCKTPSLDVRPSPGPYACVNLDLKKQNITPEVRVCISEEPYLRKIDVYHAEGEFLGTIASPSNFINGPYVTENVYSFVDGYSGQRLDDLTVRLLPIGELIEKSKESSFFTEQNVDYWIKK